MTTINYYKTKTFIIAAIIPKKNEDLKLKKYKKIKIKSLRS